MSALTLRIPKGSPLTNAEVDANFVNLLVALGGANVSPWTIPAPAGTGSPVLSDSPTFTGHPTIEGVTSTGATGTGDLVFSASPTFTGHPTIEGVTSTGATGTGDLVFSDSPTFTGTSSFANVSISTHEYIGSQANGTRFPNAIAAIANTSVGIQHNESHNIGLIAEGTAHASDANVYGIGLYGVGYTSATTRCGGVVGEAHVSASSDVGSAIGVRGYSHDTHVGGLNVGLYGDATSGSENYALYLNSGNIYTVGAKSWVMNGDITFSGAYAVVATDFNSTSDVKLKENVQPLTNSIDVINKLNPVSFTWKENGKLAYGLIAQEVEEVLPELVSTSDDTKSVKYLNLIALLLNAVKEQDSVIAALDARLTAIEEVTK